MLISNGTITANGTIIPIDVRDMSSLLIQLTGFGSATIQFEFTIDGTNWYSLNCYPNGSTTAATSATGNGIWFANVSGVMEARVRASAYSSGTIAVLLSATQNGDLAIPSSGGSGSNAAAGATGSAVPASADYSGINVGGTLRGRTGVNPSGSVFAAQTDITSVNGATVATAASGIMKVGLTDGSGNVINSTSNALNVNVANATLAVTESGTWNVGASTATGSAVPANAFYGGGIAKTALPTAGSDGNLTGIMVDKFGRQIVMGGLRELKGTQKTTITSSVSETTIVTAGGAGVFCDLYGLAIANTSASACNVTIKDATAGTTRFIFAVPAGETRGFMLPQDSAHPQNTANNNWTATCSASVASIEITALFVNNK